MPFHTNTSSEWLDFTKNLLRYKLRDYILNPMQIVEVTSDIFYEPKGNACPFKLNETACVALYKVIRILFSLMVIVLFFFILHLVSLINVY